MPEFKNPIIPGFNPDPSICRVGDSFFLITSSFEYFPGIPIYHSKDLVKWEHIGHVLTRPTQLNLRTVEPGAGIWASTIRYVEREKRWYVTTCKWDRYRPTLGERVWPRGFVVYTDDIWKQDSWSDPIYFDQIGFDQDLFFDDDGKVYLSTTYRLHNPPDSTQKHFAIHVSEIDINTGRSLTAPIVLRTAPSGLAEGSHIIKRGRYYYLFTAEGGTETHHSEWVMRSSQGPLGPYEVGPLEAVNPLVCNSTNEDVQNTGHADLVEDCDGNWWAVLLAVRPTRIEVGEWVDSALGRETFILPVEWVEDWPIFNEGRPIGLSGEGPKMYRLQQPTDWVANLSLTDLELGWYHKHTPLRKYYSLSERPGHLRVYGSSYDLASPESPSMLVRKQSAKAMTFTADLDFSPARPTYEAGVVAFWNSFCYFSIGIKKDADGYKKLVVTEPVDGKGNFKSHAHAVSDLSVNTTRLAIKCTATSYSVGYVASSGFHCLSTVSTKIMTTAPPLGMAYTGVMLGVYAFGEMEPCLSPADFSGIRLALTE
ncbi:glycosyl hydrolase [Myxozyma melibiosi]|uniref:Glycosyl hydrolase n=1 Tax=Myxozyma melibiosi TaxID=54550 RepID=A0ABR1FB48_9ASCO